MFDVLRMRTKKYGFCMQQQHCGMPYRNDDMLNNSEYIDDPRNRLPTCHFEKYFHFNIQPASFVF